MARKVPFEIAGFVDRRVWTVDSFRGTARYRWCFFVNDNVDEKEVLPWTGDSPHFECPF